MCYVNMNPLWLQAPRESTATLFTEEQLRALIAEEITMMSNKPLVEEQKPPFEILLGMLYDFHKLTENNPELRKEYLGILNYAILKCYSL